jgi:hypothetical protein
MQPDEWIDGSQPRDGVKAAQPGAASVLAFHVDDRLSGAARLRGCQIRAARAPAHLRLCGWDKRPYAGELGERTVVGFGGTG